ncbi:MAG TPA: hypothetical protein VJW51_06185 [Candidatus Acidoferrales bacterium]|nr:hypothetical protein [Candidatus Acidoferrales bacterium]
MVRHRHEVRDLVARLPAGRKPDPLFAAFSGAANQHKLARGRVRTGQAIAAGD